MGDTVHFNADGNLQQVLAGLVREVEALGHKVIKGTVAFKDLGEATNAVELKVKTATGTTRSWTGEVDKLAKSFELASLNQSKFGAETQRTINRSVTATAILGKLQKNLIPEIGQLSPEKRFDVDVAGVRLADYLTKNKISLDFFNKASAAFGSGTLTKEFKGQDLNAAIDLIKQVQSFQSTATGARASLFGGLENLPKIKDAASLLGKEIKAIEPGGLKNLKAVVDDTPKSLDRLSSMVTKLGTDLDTTKQSVDNFGISWNTVFRLYTIQLLHRALSATIREIKEGIGEAIKLQVAIAEIQTIDTGKNPFSTWLVGLRQLSDQFGTSLPDQTEAAYQALSNQIVNSAKEFEILGAKVNEFALATKSSAANSIELLTGVLNAYNLTLADTDRVFAQLFKTIELGRVRAEEIGNTYGRVLVPASQLGVSLEEVNAAMTLMTIQGVKANEAMTLLRNIFQKLIRPTEEMKRFYEEIGVASGEAAIATFGFAGLMKLIEERTQGSSTELGEMFGRIRAITGAMTFSRGNLERYNKDLNEIRNSTQDYGNAVDIVLNNLGKRLQIEGQQITNFFTVDLGNSILTAADAIPHFTENIDTLVKSLTGLVTLVAGGTFGILISKLSVLSRLSALPLGPFFAGTVITGLVAAFIASTTEAENLKNALEETGTAAEKLYHEKHRQEVQRTIDILQQYSQAVTNQVQNELRLLAERDKIYQSAVNSRVEAIKKISKLTTNDLQYLDKKIGELSKTIKKNLDELIRKRDALADAIPDQQGNINDARFRAIDDKNFVAQQEFLTKRLKDLEEQRVKAAAEGNVDLYNKLTGEIESLLDKLEQVEFARAKEYNLVVNLATIEKQRTEEQAKQLAYQEKMKALLDAQIDADEKRLLDAEKYQRELSDLVDGVRGFNSDTIKNAKDNEELNKIIEERTKAYDALREALARDPELNKIKLTNLEQQRAEEDRLVKSKRDQLGVEEKQTKLQTAQRDLVDAQAKIKEEIGKKEQFKGLTENIVAQVIAAVNTNVDLIKEEAGTFVRNTGFKAGSSANIAAMGVVHDLIPLIEALNSFKTAPTDKTLLNLKEAFKTLVSNRPNDENVGLMDAYKAVFGSEDLKHQGTKIDVILTNLDALVATFIDDNKKIKESNEALKILTQREESLLDQIAALQKEQGLRTTSLAGANPQILIDLAADVKKIANRPAQGFAAGGFVPGFGNGDTVSALLTPGEFVMNKRAAMRFRPQLIAMNQGYAQGGEVVNVGGISVTVTGGSSSKSTVEEIADGINRAIRTKRIRLRK